MPVAGLSIDASLNLVNARVVLPHKTFTARIDQNLPGLPDRGIKRRPGEHLSWIARSIRNQPREARVFFSAHNGTARRHAEDQAVAKRRRIGCCGIKRHAVKLLKQPWVGRTAARSDNNTPAAIIPGARGVRYGDAVDGAPAVLSQIGGGCACEQGNRAPGNLLLERGEEGVQNRQAAINALLVPPGQEVIMANAGHRMPVHDLESMVCQPVDRLAGVVHGKPRERRVSGAFVNTHAVIKVRLRRVAYIQPLLEYRPCAGNLTG